MVRARFIAPTVRAAFTPPVCHHMYLGTHGRDKSGPYGGRRKRGPYPEFHAARTRHFTWPVRVLHAAQLFFAFLQISSQDLARSGLWDDIDKFYKMDFLVASKFPVGERNNLFWGGSVSFA
jgi:hypothetical protein